jgi:hypothetical protein
MYDATSLVRRSSALRYLSGGPLIDINGIVSAALRAFVAMC